VTRSLDFPLRGVIRVAVGDINIRGAPSTHRHEMAVLTVRRHSLFRDRTMQILKLDCAKPSPVITLKSKTATKRSLAPPYKTNWADCRCTRNPLCALLRGLPNGLNQSPLRAATSWRRSRVWRISTANPIAPGIDG